LFRSAQTGSDIRHALSTSEVVSAVLTHGKLNKQRSHEKAAVEIAIEAKLSEFRWLDFSKAVEITENSVCVRVIVRERKKQNISSLRFIVMILLTQNLFRRCPMRSGKKNHVLEKKVHIHLKDYANAHKDVGCKGKWKIAFQFNTPFSVDALGFVQVPILPFVACESCKSAYIAPGFEEFLEKRIATQLVLNTGLLNKDQIRFLRLAFDLTQDDLAKTLGFADRHYYAKMEAKKSQQSMSPDKQVRLKLYYAKLLGIQDIDQIYEMVQPDENKNAELSPKELVSKAEIEGAYLLSA